MIGAWSGATDGYDSAYDSLLFDGAPGYAGVYHENDERGWSGPTGFYRRDMRAPVLANETKTWEPIHLWAEPEYAEDDMHIAFAPAPDLPPPPDRVYTLELLYVPPGMIDPPAVGTIWEIPTDETFSLKVPTYRSENGLTGYQFAFSIHAVPEPSTVLLLALGSAVLIRRR